MGYLIALAIAAILAISGYFIARSADGTDNFGAGFIAAVLFVVAVLIVVVTIIVGAWKHFS